MGQTHSNHFQDAAIKEQFNSLQALWTDQDLVTLIDRLKDMTLNFSLDKVKFAKLLQLSVAFEDTTARWFQDFSHDRASQVVDGLEFLSAVIMVSSKVSLFRKTCLLFSLFDLDRTGCIRKDEFTIFLKAVSTGLHRVVSGLPPPATVLELGGLSTEFFNTLSSQVLSQKDLLIWMTEAHFSLHYLSVLSKLQTCVFAWGTNHRYQLGLNLEPRQQRVPAPVLSLEGMRIATIASHESHCLFVTEEGQCWSCGSGFCGLLGHGDTSDSMQPRLIEALSHTRIVDVAVGVRHSAAVSEKGQVFTWGSADMGQLGHGDTGDREVHEWAYCPKSGGTFAYVTKPTVVISLHGRKVHATKVGCSNFSTACLTDQGHVYTWGNNTDGQCGQGQKCPEHRLIYVDPHMQRTAMQALILPRRVEVDQTFQKIACGGYHTLALDSSNRVWSWGRGLWGPLGHGDQRSMYEPKLVSALRHQVSHEIAAGEAHSTCLSSLYRLTVSGTADVELSPFSLLGLPVGRVDREAARRELVTPPNTTLNLNAFVCARLLQVPLPFQREPEAPIVDAAQCDPAEIAESVVMIDRALWPGEWLKLETTDFDFNVKMSPMGAELSRSPISAQFMFGVEGKWEPNADCIDKICIFDCPASDSTAPEDLVPVILALATQCEQGHGWACLIILPRDVEVFSVEAESGELLSIPLGVMSFDHGATLKKHITRLINMRIAEAPEGVPADVQDWRECHEEFTGRTYFENIATGDKRWAPPQISPNAVASLFVVEEDQFLPRLQAMIALKPKGIIVCQQSWKPDVELVELDEETLESLDLPIVMVTYEAGEELKSVASNGSLPFVTMEVQPYGGVFAWGNGTYGQLGLAGIENQNFQTQSGNVLTGEVNSFASQPHYVAHLHEHQVSSIACGSAHTVAVTQQGDVFTWGSADGLGVLHDKPVSEMPIFVEQLENLVRSTQAFAGHYHSFVVADMPYKSIV